jgi:hypothetical protein
MTEQEFHTIRQSLYLDDNLNIKVATGKYANLSHAEWFSVIGYPYVHTVRGYYMKTEDDEYVILYWNDFEVPNVNASLFAYIFSYFPNIKWLGLGCNVGKIGEPWKPKYKIYRELI